MLIMKAKVKNKGEVKIPEKIREYLNLNSSDTIDFKISDNGRVYIDTPEHSVDELNGILSQYKKSDPLTTEQMDQIIKNKAKDRANR